MPLPSLTVTKGRLLRSVNQLESAVSASSHIDFKNRSFIAEIVLIRLFGIVEDANEEIALKLIAGAEYLDGSKATISQSAKSIQGARQLVLTHGRNSHWTYAKWSTSDDVKFSTRHLMNQSEHFRSVCRQYNQSVLEMRAVRNHSAHNTASTRRKFHDVIDNTYGAKFSMPVGTFLLTTKRTTTSNLTRYFITVRALLDDLTRGS